jgi:hypothetical protein
MSGYFETCHTALFLWLFNLNSLMGITVLSFPMYQAVTLYFYILAVVTLQFYMF